MFWNTIKWICLELCAFEKQIKFGVSCKHLHLKNMVICHQHYKLKYLVLYHIIFCTKTKMANSGNCSVLYLKKKKHPASAAFLSHKILSKQTFFCVCVNPPSWHWVYHSWENSWENVKQPLMVYLFLSSSVSCNASTLSILQHLAHNSLTEASQRTEIPLFHPVDSRVSVREKWVDFMIVGVH